MRMFLFSISYTGFSMYSYLHPGDVLICRKTADDELQSGDIIIAQNSSRRKHVAHRVIRVKPLLTKGDNLTFTDKMEHAEIKGKVLAIKRGGKILNVGLLRGRLMAFLSRWNLTPIILKTRFAVNPLKKIYSAVRTLSSKIRIY